MNQELKISVDIPESYQNKIREAYCDYKKTYNDILSQIGDVGELEVLSSKKLYENFTDRELTVYFSDNEKYYNDDIAYYEEDIYNKDILWLQKRLFFFHYYDGNIEIEFNDEKQEKIKDILKKLREVSSKHDDKFINLVKKIPNTLENIVIKSEGKIWGVGRKDYVCLSSGAYVKNKNRNNVVYLIENMFLRYYTGNFIKMKIFNSKVEKKLDDLKKAEKKYFKIKEKILREAELKEVSVRKQILEFSNVRSIFDKEIKKFERVNEKVFEETYKEISKKIKLSVEKEIKKILEDTVELDEKEKVKYEKMIKLKYEKFEEKEIENLKNKPKEIIQNLNSEIDDYIRNGKIYIERLEELTIGKIKGLKEKIILELNKFLKNLPNEFKKVRKKIRIEKLVSIFVDKDFDRFRSKKYDTEIYDRNKGSWDVFEATNENNDVVIDGEKINEEILDRKIYGRNPKNDIVKSGVIGIDFGTKSTVVVSYKDDNEGINGSKTLPIRISGNLDAIERTENYENATIIHFDNIKKFITEYLSSEGRPYTHYDDIQVSVDAENELKRTQNNFDINEFMLDLKQWSANKNKKKTIADKTGKEIILNGYLELNENEFDPIEIYAYYIGCRINNMAQYSIFLEYILSFPVTYELEVKNKILNSFRKGIMKSLPNSILNDEEIMKNFRVKFGASEPASYAITALKKFCVEPDLENEIGYSVFDFGGGTTDFSYGIYREKENSRKYDYEIQELESGGDKYLGGENLLSLIAFDVFLQNREKMFEKGYEISLPINQKSKIGFETFVSESNQAEYNMKKIMESMRDYWEGKLEETEKEKLKKTIYLSNKSGQYQNEELDIDYNRLDEILKKNIYNGVISFLEKFKVVFDSKKLKEIYIFLAGNSSKSKFVEEIFENELTEEFKQKYNIILKDAYSIKNEIEGEVIGLNSKTGVAFGLVELREGNGEVEYIPFRNITKNEEINFKYCIGYSKKRRFVPIIDFNTKYNEWIKYDDIENENSIEVLYSGDTRAEGKEFPASECLRIRILVQDDESGSLFIRLKNPNTIEYVICEDIKDIDKTKISEEILK
ncbi:hypothetical protein JCM16777_0858 [Leptotrichia wadei]|uniref:Uncharacterized protein n=1 Tax=Leptotrichia wadei TaxID=157687 RepID=A0A7U6LA30_9FUSO|nr:hypothetical protein [Leptotrichia wadei]BBM42609.1 hypothetical protein JCM16777_0858 [Leptotrichia wadei]